MNGPQDDGYATLTALIDPIAQAARLVLIHDALQLDELRAEAITMPAERLFWTLTQLDGGLSLDVCQALVRAVHLADRRCPVRGRLSDEVLAAEAAARTATAWLRRRWATMPDMTELVAWLARDDRLEGLAAADWYVLEHRVPVETALPYVLVTAGSAAPLPEAPASWLDLPPLVGPPSGAGDPSGVTRVPLFPAGGAEATDRAHAGGPGRGCLLGLLVVVGAAVSWAAGVWDLTVALALASGVAALRGLPRLAQPG